MLFDDDVIKVWLFVDDEYCINVFYNFLLLVYVIKIKKIIG